MQVAVVVLHSNLGKSERSECWSCPAKPSQSEEDGVEAVLLLPRVLAVLGTGRQLGRAGRLRNLLHHLLQPDLGHSLLGHL